MRESKDTYYLNIAKEIATRGTCLKRRYGAVIVNNDEIISTGYTGSPRGCVNCSDTGVCNRGMNPSHDDYAFCKSVHAEANAIISASRRDMLGSTLYLVGLNSDGSIYNTDGPCLMCKKMIINAGISRVVYLTPDDRVIRDTSLYINYVDNLPDGDSH